jgi:hypothetical protein
MSQCAAIPRARSDEIVGRWQLREAYAMTMYLTEREWDELQNNTRCI